MWWKSFLETDTAITSLPYENVYKLNKSSILQLEKMQSHESELQAHIAEISVELCKFIANDEQIVLSSDPTTSPLLSGEEQRYQQLCEKLNNLQTEREQIEEEINYQETLLHQLAMTDQKKNQQLKYGSTNFAQFPQVVQLCDLLTDMALNSDKITERDEYLLCLDLISGGSRVLSTQIKQNKAYFIRRSTELKRELDGLLIKSAKKVAKVHEINQSLESIIQKADIVGPMLPKMEKQLKSEIKEFGDTRQKLLDIKRIVEEHKTKRDSLQNECANLSSSLLSQPLNSGLSQKEMDEQIQLKQIKMDESIRQNQLAQNKKLIESQMNDYQSSMEELEVENQEIENQCSVIQSAIKDQKWRFQRLKDAKIEPQHLETIVKLSKKLPLTEYEEQIAQAKEHLSILEKRKKSVKEKMQKQKDQELKFDTQIAQLTDLLEAAQFEKE